MIADERLEIELVGREQEIRRAICQAVQQPVELRALLRHVNELQTGQG